jgi:hypothetical protein
VLEGLTVDAVFATIVWLTMIAGAVTWTYRHARRERDRETHGQLTAPLVEVLPATETFWWPESPHPHQRYAELIKGRQADADAGLLSQPFGDQPHGRHRAPERPRSSHEFWSIAGRTHLRRRIMEDFAKQQCN